MYPEGTSGREYYEDDGISFDYQRGKFLKRRIEVTSGARNETLISVTAREGS